MKEYEVQDAVGRLAGKRIILGGAKSRNREGFCRELQCVASWGGCAVLEGTAHTQKGDYVILFTDAGPDGSVPVPQELLKEMTGLCARKPASVLLVSDAGVYGRFYGDIRPRKEPELGYAGHTRPEDIPLQRMRLAEHVACRLAREEGLPVKAARVSGEWPVLQPAITQPAGGKAVMSGERQGEGAAGMPLSKEFFAAVKVLLYGENGEIYNLPEQEMHESGQQSSPLSPQKLQIDAGKVEKLSCCETI